MGARRSCPVVGIVLALAACAPDMRTAVLQRVVLDTPRALDSLTAEREALRQAVRARLGAKERVRWDDNGEQPTHVLHLVLGETILQGDEPVRPVQVRLKPVGADQEYLAIGYGAANADWSVAALSAFEEAWAKIQRMRVLNEASEGDLLAALRGEDVTVREFAVRRLGERRSVAAVEPLSALLSTESDQQLVLRVIGALVAIGDPRAVEALIGLTRQQDPAFVLQVVFAVGAIGGRTAEGFLVTLAGGHPVPQVRQGAEDALKEMQRRASVRAATSRHAAPDTRGSDP